VTLIDDLRPGLRQDCGSQVGQTPTRWVSDLSPMYYRGADATMATDNVNSFNADEEIEFATSMAAMLRTAARAADEFGVSCRELARRFAEQVEPIMCPMPTPWDCQSAWRSGRSTSKGTPSLPHSMNAGPLQIRPSTGKPQSASNWWSRQVPASTVQAAAVDS
jgi:hypothetical protein